MEAVAIRFEAIRLEAIAIWLEAVAIRLEAMWPCENNCHVVQPHETQSSHFTTSGGAGTGVALVTILDEVLDGDGADLGDALGDCAWHIL